MKSFHAAFLVVLAPMVAMAAELPEELKHLQDMVDNEHAVVDAMRNFQLLQDELINWDSELAQQYNDSDEEAVAETKADDVRHRLSAVEAGWQYLLAKYPNNPRVNNYYGEYLYDHTKNQPEAVRYWLQATSLDPDFGPAHNNLGVHYLHNGSARLGLQELHSALEIDPNNPDYLFNITQAYLNYRVDVQRWYHIPKTRVYEEAMEFSKRAAEVAPNDLAIVQDYAVNFYAAENFGVKPDWQKAAEAWDKVIAIAKAPEDRHYAILNKARVFIRMEKWSEAIPLLEQTLQLVPDSEAATNLLAQCRQKVEESKSGKKKKERHDEPL